MKYQLEINAHRGYSAGQVRAITVGELKDMLDGLDDDDTIITFDSGNARGAAYGEISAEVNEVEPDEDEE